MKSERKYQDFASRIDVDAFEEAIDFVPTKTDDDGNDIGHCPDIWGLHKNGDTTGKFAIHREKKVYNCWVCGGGSFLSFAMEFKNVGEQEAANWLYQFASEDAISNEGFVEEIERMLATESGYQPATLPYFNSRVLQNLDFAYDWGSDKNIPSPVIEHFGIRFDKARVRANYEGPAIVLPHFWQGRLVGWQERWLDEDKPEWIPKYTNTSDFPREQTLYNYDWTMFDQEVVVVESVPTALVLMGLSIPAIATFGSNVTSEQMRLLRRCTAGIVIAPDNDNPGIKFIESLYEGLDRYIPLKAIEPVGEDGSGSDLGDLKVSDDILDAVRGAKFV